eukprot:s1670_g4.t1
MTEEYIEMSVAARGWASAEQRSPAYAGACVEQGGGCGEDAALKSHLETIFAHGCWTGRNRFRFPELRSFLGLRCWIHGSECPAAACASLTAQTLGAKGSKQAFLEIVGLDATTTKEAHSFIIDAARRMQFCYDELLANEHQQRLFSFLGLIVAALEISLAHLRRWSHELRPRNPHHEETLQGDAISCFSSEDMIASTFGVVNFLPNCSAEDLEDHERLERGISRQNFASPAAAMRDFNTAISACATARHWQKALQVFSSMPTANVAPSIVSYNAAINAFEKGRQWQLALQFFASMLDAGLTPNVISYSTSIHSCARGALWQCGVGLFVSMQSTQVVPNVISYNATISCCEKSGHWQAALQLFASMLDAQCTPDIISYSAFVT